MGIIILTNQKIVAGHIHITMSEDGDRGKGYGTDAVNTMVQYAFEKLILNCISANNPSYNESFF